MTFSNWINGARKTFVTPASGPESKESSIWGAGNSRNGKQASVKPHGNRQDPERKKRNPDHSFQGRHRYRFRQRRFRDNQKSCPETAVHDYAEWVKTRTQPIGVKDVVSYLTAALDLPVQGNLVVDIGSTPLDFSGMMLDAAGVMGLRRYLLPVPVLSPRLSSYWLLLFTQVPYKIASALVDGLKSETLVFNDNAAKYFPDIHPMGYKEAVELALRETEQDQVISRWCDSSAGKTCDVFGLDDPSDAILHDRRTVPYTGLSQESVFQSVCSIGGERGWFTYHALWRLRGFMDKLFGGYGLSRGKGPSGICALAMPLTSGKLSISGPAKDYCSWPR
jgi:hypothetical protein